MPSNIDELLKKLKPNPSDLAATQYEEALSDLEEAYLSSYDDPNIIEEAIGGDYDKIQLVKLQQELKTKEHDLETKRHQLKELKRDSSLKKNFYRNVTKLVKCWLSFIATLILFDSFNVAWGKYEFFDFDIDSNVLIAIVTGTTASVIGLYLAIGRYLFPNGHNDN